MKRTEYVTLQDQTLIDLFQQLGEDVSNLELMASTYWLRNSSMISFAERWYFSCSC